MSHGSLTRKLIHGKPYYYLCFTQRVDGKPKVVRTVYLGKVERCDEAVRLAEVLDRDLSRNADALRSIAQAFALCGESGRALDVLEEAIPLGYPPAYLRLEDEFKALHENPRFEALASS